MIGRIKMWDKLAVAPHGDSLRKLAMNEVKENVLCSSTGTNSILFWREQEGGGWPKSDWRALKVSKLTAGVVGNCCECGDRFMCFCCCWGYFLLLFLFFVCFFFFFQFWKWCGFGGNGNGQCPGCEDNFIRLNLISCRYIFLFFFFLFTSFFSFFLCF